MHKAVDRCIELIVCCWLQPQRRHEKAVLLRTVIQQVLSVASCEDVVSEVGNFAGSGQGMAGFPLETRNHFSVWVSLTSQDAWSFTLLAASPASLEPTFLAPVQGALTQKGKSDPLLSNLVSSLLHKVN